ncbi:phage tail protein [Dryocola clanedunensis]|uniref:phage tail protein n=1 Tax=Cedecea sulfonylureivorans TaxID=3051154 RepID=UPI001927F327|nr:phage tail protein [Cedecea sulfonylureivorans]
MLEFITDQYVSHESKLSPTQFVLGDFVFSLPENTPAVSLSRKYDGGWAVIDLLNELPGQQQTGRKLDERVIKCEWFLDEGQDNIEKLVKLRDRKKPLPLVRGDGTLLGQWVLTGFDVDESWLYQEAKSMKQGVTISLREFANKPIEQKKQGSSAK